MTTSSSISSSENSGKVVGTVSIKGRDCEVVSYSLGNDHGGYFTIDQQGQILLAINHPHPGKYTIPIVALCDGESKAGNAVILVSTSTIPATTWLRHFGTATISTGNTSQFERCYGLVTDFVGNSYCAGYTYGELGEVSGGGSDVFITKLGPLGNVVWTTQLGATTVPSGGDTSGDDFCFDVALDSLGNVYCSGYTTGSLGEIQGGSDDLIILKLDNDGNLVWLKQVGGNTTVPGGDVSGFQRAFGISIDSKNNIYVGGGTDLSFGENKIGTDDDAFVAKFSSTGNIIWIKQLGTVTPVPGGSTSSTDGYYDVAVDGSGNLYAAGVTRGDLGESYGEGSYDAVVSKYDTNGNLVWVRQLGAVTVTPGGNPSGTDFCWAISVDSAGNSYCTGSTTGALGEGSGGGVDAFIMKLDPGGNISWIRQLGNVTTVPGGGTNGNDYCLGSANDALGNVYCAGMTTSALGEANAGNDAFVMKLSSSGSITWLTQLGATTIPVGGSTAGDDRAQYLSVDSNGGVIVSGRTTSSLNESNSGGFDAYVMKFNANGDLL